jgi:hypothetical protein
MLFYDYNKRNYLLPPGCKDLIDLLRLEQQKGQFLLYPGQEELPEASQPKPWILPSQQKKSKASEPMPAAAGSFREVQIPECIAVSELAKLVGQKPFRIIADLMTIGVFATLHSDVAFEAAEKVLRNYGLIAKKAAG